MTSVPSIRPPTFPTANTTWTPTVKKGCLVCVRGSYIPGLVLEVKGDRVEMRVYDLSQHPREWRPQIFRLADLKPINYEKCTTSKALVDYLTRDKRILKPGVIDAMTQVDRAWFCHENPYHDDCIDIGHRMVISTPRMHALILELCADLLPEARAVLDVGSGSGYLTALLAAMAPQAKVYGIEYFSDLVEKSTTAIQTHMPTSSVQIKQGNGEEGYAEGRPYSVICVGFMGPKVPGALLTQLAPGGKMVIPLGEQQDEVSDRYLYGQLVLIEKREDGTIDRTDVCACAFVPSVSFSKP